MIKCNGNRAFLGDREVLENAVKYIKKTFQEKHWGYYAKEYHVILARSIGWHLDEVRGFFHANNIDFTVSEWSYDRPIK